MGLLSRHLRIPRPTRFLGVMSLGTGVEMISVFMIFNKLTGFYGLLAILTGLRLSSLQISMYIYSCLAILILACLIPHIRKQSPFQCMLLSYFYLIDTVTNILFTCAFAINWLLAVTSGSSTSSTILKTDNVAKAMTLENQMYNFSSSKIVAKPLHSVTAVNEALLYSMVSATASSGSRYDEIVPSVVLVAALSMIRIYFVLVVLAYARQVIRRHVFLTSLPKQHLHTDGCADNLLGNNLFTFGSSEESAWKAKLGRLMITMCEDYWIGEAKKTEDAWAKGIDSRFRISKKLANEPPGTVERERRARSGTGPPMPFLKP